MLKAGNIQLESGGFQITELHALKIWCELFNQMGNMVKTPHHTPAENAKCQFIHPASSGQNKLQILVAFTLV